ncbi:MAG: plastocyanin/azurin family copper-binding protein [Gemmatimonadales bacterium]
MRNALWLTSMVLAAACGSDPTGRTGSPTPPPPPVATNAADVRDNRFDPVAVSVGASSTVTWTWRGINTHNVTFEDGQGSSTTKTAGTHQRAFGSAGTFRYRCTIHSTNFDSGMVGSVVVQ